MIRYFLWSPVFLIWILASFATVGIFLLFVSEFSVSSFWGFFLIFTLIALIVGLFASVPLIIWMLKSSLPWRKRWLFFVLVAFLSLLLFYRLSALIGTGFKSFPKPPEAVSSSYYYHVEGGLGPSIQTGFRFGWGAESPDVIFSKVVNTARFYDEWAKKEGYKMEAYPYDDSNIPVSCEESAKRRVQISKRELEEDIRGGEQPTIFLYLDCGIKNHIPGVDAIYLTLDEGGGEIKFPT